MKKKIAFDINCKVSQDQMFSVLNMKLNMKAKTMTLESIFSALVSLVLLVTAIFENRRAKISLRKAEKAEERAQTATLDADSSREKLRGITLPISVDGPRSSTVLVGIGGSGKTTLIKSLSGKKEIVPSEKTKNYQLYNWQHGSAEGIQTGIPITFYIGDYKGQNIGSLFREFIKHQKKPFHPMAWGYITSLILIVDLIEPGSNEDELVTYQKARPSKSRIKEHCEQWNETALDAVFGFFTRDQGKYVCLFINKYDVMADHSIEAEDSIFREYKELEQRLRERADGLGAKFERILGSGKTGDGMIPLRASLAATSVTDSDNAASKDLDNVER